MIRIYREVYGEYESEEEIRLEKASDFLEGILQHIYGNKELDEDNLNHCVEEICELLGNRCPLNELTIKRK